jgi:hypothetical protein
MLKTTKVTFSNSIQLCHRIENVNEMLTVVASYDSETQEAILHDFKVGLLQAFTTLNGYFFVFRVKLGDKEFNVVNNFVNLEPSSCIIDGCVCLNAELYGYHGRYLPDSRDKTVDTLTMEAEGQVYADALDACYVF